MDYYSNHGSPNRHGSDSYRRSSPGYTERRPRVRSRSPHSIDRYQPGDRPRERERERDREHGGQTRDRGERDREGHSKRRDDGGRRRSPGPSNIDRYVPGQEAAPVVLSVNPMPNPNSLDTPVGFTYFAEWWRLEQQVQDERDRQKYGSIRPDRLKDREERGKDREQIQAAYDTYKEKLQIQILKNFIQQHKAEEWFKEKYDANVRVSTAEALLPIRQESYFRWAEDVEAGVFDNFTLEGIPKNEANASQAHTEKEEGETSGGNEVLGVGDLVALPGGDLRDSTLQAPTLLIKTIAPTVSRAKLEEFCKEHLGQGEGGYKWLSLSDPNPLKKYHRIGWVVLTPSAPAMQDDDDDDGVIPESNASAQALEALNGKTVFDEIRGDFTCHVGIHEPPSTPRKKALWDLFSSPDRIERDLELAARLATKLDSTLGPDYNSIAIIQAKLDELGASGLLNPSQNLHTSNSQTKHSHNQGLDDDDEEDEEGLCEDDEDSGEVIHQKKKLDLIVEYLRRVFNFCFFCVFESDSVHELTRKCPGGHLRRPKSCLSSTGKMVAKASALGDPFPLKKPDLLPTPDETDVANSAPSTDEASQQTTIFLKPSSKTHQQLQRAFNWVKNYEERLMQVLDADNVDLRKIGGRPLDEALDDDLSRFVKQEDDSKFRCKLPECTKLFKAYHFWRKHVEKRHDDFFANIKRDIEMMNAYLLDPGHLVPPHVRPDISTTHPHLSQTPGFSPRSGGSISSFPPGFNMLQNFPAMFINGHTNQNRDAGARAGPIRTRDNRRPFASQARLAGPYSRPDGVDVRRNGGAGTGLAGRHSSPGRGGAGPAPTGAAIQGRSLKSYEDLDAAGPGGDNTTDQLEY